VAFAASVYPPAVPLTCESGVRRDKRQQRRGRWLKKCSSENTDRECQQIAPSKPVTVLVVLERWRGFCAVDRMRRLCGQINAVPPSRFLVVLFSAMGIQGCYDGRWD
jgi:hypothetical protein